MGTRLSLVLGLVGIALAGNVLLIWSLGRSSPTPDPPRLLPDTGGTEGDAAFEVPVAGGQGRRGSPQWPAEPTDATPVVRGAVAGRVVDGEGEPVVGAHLFWLPAEGLDRERVGRRGGESKEDGRFRLADLPAGAVRLAARAPGGVARWGRPVPVRGGEETGGVVLLCESGVALAGRIFDADTGEGVAGSVRLTSSFGHAPLEARAGDDGSFVLEGVAREASYSLAVSSRGYAYSHPAGGFASRRVLVTADGLLLASGLQVPVRRAVLRPLRVLDDATGAPLAGALVSPAPAAGPSRQRHPHREDGWPVIGRTDGAGLFAPEGEAPEPVVVVQAEGYLSEWADVALAEPDAAPQVVRLRRGSTLEVRVQGGPATVEVQQAPAKVDRFAMVGDPPVLLRGETTDGVAHLAPVPPGAHVVRGRAAGGRVGLVEVFVREGQDATVELDLVEPGALFGTVTGAPLEILATGVLYGLTQRALALPDGAGAWRLDGLHPGEYRLHAIARGARSTGHGGGRVVRVSPGQSLRVDLGGFGAPASLVGRATLNGGPAAFRVLDLEWVAARGDPDGVLVGRDRRGVTDAEGVYRIPDLEPGHWRVSLQSSLSVPFPLATREVRLEEGREHSLQLAASSGSLVIETRREGRPAGWVTVEIVPEGDWDGPERLGLTVEGSGRLAIEAFPVGSYRIRSGRSKGGQISFQVAPGGSRTVYLELR